MKKHFTAIILAAGVGSRMESTTPKQYMEVAGYPVLYHTIKAFQDSPIIKEIILVVSENQRAFSSVDIVQKYNFTKVTQITTGGSERHNSVQKGLCKLSLETEYVMIHDGARPVVSNELLERGYNSMQESSASIAVVPAKDTIKRVSPDGVVLDTLNRSELYVVQTPQVFSRKLIVEAYTNAEVKYRMNITNKDKKNLENDICKKSSQVLTDDAMVVEEFTNVTVKVFEGDYKNIKITTPEDLEIAELFLRT